MTESVEVNIKNNETSTNYDGETFEPNHDFIRDIINDVIKIKDN